MFPLFFHRHAARGVGTFVQHLFYVFTLGVLVCFPTTTLESFAGAAKRSPNDVVAVRMHHTEGQELEVES